MLLQAEQAQFTGAIVTSEHPGSVGGYVDLIEATNASITWAFMSSGEGDARLAFRYALGVSTPRTMQLQVNGVTIGNVTFTQTGTWATWGTLELLAPVTTGSNTIRLVAIGQSGPNFDSLNVTEPAVEPTFGTLQAEAATISGAVVSSEHAGAQGGAFVDYLNASGDSITWTVISDQDGMSPISIRYALGVATSRTMALEVNGVIVNNAVTFISTGAWTNWGSLDLNVPIVDGQNTIRLIANGSSGPNVDSLTIEAPVNVESSLIFQAEAATLSGAVIAANWAGGQEGAFVDYLNPNGDAITWSFEADHGGTYAISLRYALGLAASRTMALEVNGTIVNSAVTFTSTGTWTNWGTLDLNIPIVDGQNTVRLIATGTSGPNLDSLTVHGLTHDGPLWREFNDSIDTLQPGETGIPLDSSFSIGVQIFDPGQVLDSATVNTTTVRLINIASGQALPIAVNTTGGGDSLSITPSVNLQPNTAHVLVINGVKGINGEDYLPTSRAFTTGTQSQDNPPEGVAFNRQVVSSGDPIASLTFSADYSMLYACTMTGSIIRWNVESDGSLSNRHVFVVEEGRTLIGIVVDPTNPNRIWVSNNEGYPGDFGDPFGSKISYVDITNTTTFTGTVTDYVTGLPRSAHDHLTNSLVFGPDGALYFAQGSMTAMGDTDAAWGFRPETPLSASVLRLDTTLTAPPGGFDVSTDGTTPYDPNAPGAPLTVYATGFRNAYDILFHSNGSLYAPNNGSAAGGNSPDDPSTPANEAIVNGSIESDYLFRVVEGGYYGHPNPSIGYYIRNGGNPTAGVDPAQVPEYAVGTLPDPDYGGFVYDFGFSRSPNGVAEYSGGFGGLIDGALLVTEYSTGDRIVGLMVNGAGDVVDNFALVTGLNNPLDVVVHAPTGNIYVTNFASELSFTDDNILLLKPVETSSATLSSGGELIV